VSGLGNVTMAPSVAAAAYPGLAHARTPQERACDAQIPEGISVIVRATHESAPNRAWFASE